MDGAGATVCALALCHGFSGPVLEAFALWFLASVHHQSWVGISGSSCPAAKVVSRVLGFDIQSSNITFQKTVAIKGMAGFSQAQFPGGPGLEDGWFRLF